MGIWRFILVVVALALAWLVEGLFGRLTGWLRWPHTTDPDFSVWGNALKKPAGDPAAAREFLATNLASVPGPGTGGRGASRIFPESGPAARLPQPNNQ
jgi:hypothetical protein